jgi:hypothetical protein
VESPREGCWRWLCGRERAWQGFALANTCELSWRYRPPLRPLLTSAAGGRGGDLEGTATFIGYFEGLDRANKESLARAEQTVPE